MKSHYNAISQIFARTLLWLIPLLAIWYAARQYVVIAPAWLAKAVMTTLYPFWVYGAELHGTTQILVTSLVIPAAGGRLAQMTPQSNVLALAYGTPLLIALLLAARSNGLWWKVPVGILVLVPFQTWGICFQWLERVIMLSGKAATAQTHFDYFDGNLILICKQIGILVLPSLSPVIVWLVMERESVRQAVVEGAPHASDTV